MRIITPCLHAALIALLSAALPTAAQGQTWPWATAPTTAANSGGTMTITATALDGAGNTVVAGSFYGTITLGAFTLTSTGGADGFVARLNSAGTWTQAVRAGGSGATIYLDALTLDNAGNAVVAGSFRGPSISFGSTTLTNAGASTSSDIFVARLSSAGTWTQAVRAGGIRDEAATTLALDATGTAVVGGNFFGSTTTIGTTVLSNASPASQYVSSADFFIARLNSAGTWTQVVGVGGTDDDVLNALAVGPDGVVSAVGYFRSPSLAFGAATVANVIPQGTVTTAFVARLGSSGTWNQATANTMGSPIPTEVAVDASGNTLVSGFFLGTTTDFGSLSVANTNTRGNSSDVFVARLSSAGTWTQAVGAGGIEDDRSAGLSLDAGGNAYLTGSFRGPTASFGPITLTNATPATGSTDSRTDIFVARLSSSGTWTNAVRTGSTASEEPSDVAVNAAGTTVIVAGQFYGALTIGPFTFPAPANPLPYVAQLSGLTLGTARATRPAAVSLAPNPAHGLTQLGLPATASAQPLLLLDGLGREVRRQTVPARATAATLDVTNLLPGLYVVRYGTATGRLVVE
ncbi:T9SS type A sorting domain-containing protein [Hymenobacter chitinivorans]|uniref:Secreted protein (Por secretion system target) n=1 Tax=Hymenobacter chitinivorans DSM 11115 TaxID=1121954 RepID=A0A2M9BTQ5_9BACT|nr:T9SS type A sorting domain-containing protein [Hymenobacter chitinivorans]PJJ61292.1 hypothetical protein CLV45_2730 [Hymenobacter chitinivorans DSM 11115]